MRCATSLAVFGGLVFLAPAQAAVLTYDYQGAPLQRAYLPEALSPEDAPETLSGYAGSLVLSEDIFGGSLAGQSVSVGCTTERPVSGDLAPDYVLSASFNGGTPCTFVDLLAFDISLDADLQITDWIIDALDGPPDYISRPTGDTYFANTTYISSEPGNWTLTSIEGELAPVPLPAGGWLAAAALAGLAGVRTARR